MTKKITALLLVLFLLSACTKKDEAKNSAKMGINNDIPMTETDPSQLTDPIGLSLLELFNSQTPVPEVMDGTVIFKAPNGDTLQFRRSVLMVRMADGKFVGQMRPATRDFRGTSAEAEIRVLLSMNPEFLSSNGFDFMLNDGSVRLVWNANTLEWSLGIKAEVLTAAGVVIADLKDYELKDGFLMNTMQPIT